MRSSVISNPKFNKRFKDGEDAHVITDKFIAVLDGVSSWRRKLIDTGKMSKELAGHIKEGYLSNDGTKNLH